LVGFRMFGDGFHEGAAQVSGSAEDCKSERCWSRHDGTEWRLGGWWKGIYRALLMNDRAFTDVLDSRAPTRFMRVRPNGETTHVYFPFEFGAGGSPPICS
jgi:hypothetical protein